MRKSWTIGMLLVATTLLGMMFAPVAGVAQEAGTTDTVTVGGRRKVDVEPDLAIVSLGVRSRAATAEEASDELAARARSVIAALEGLGFTDEEIDTVDIQLDRRCISRCRSKDVEPVIGFVGSAGVRVTTAAIDRVGEVIDTGIEAGATSIRNVAFDVGDKSEAEKEALRQAFQFAREKAEVLAEAGGRTLGRALVIEEGRTEAPEAFFVSDEALGFAAGSAGSADNPFPIEPPTLKASARVTVTFELL